MLYGELILRLQLQERSPASLSSLSITEKMKKRSRRSFSVQAMREERGAVIAMIVTRGEKDPRT